jgi:hypothetical protein
VAGEWAARGLGQKSTFAVKKSKGISRHIEKFLSVLFRQRLQTEAKRASRLHSALFSSCVFRASDNGRTSRRMTIWGATNVLAGKYGSGATGYADSLTFVLGMPVCPELRGGWCGRDYLEVELYAQVDMV